MYDFLTKRRLPTTFVMCFVAAIFCVQLLVATKGWSQDTEQKTTPPLKEQFANALANTENGALYSLLSSLEQQLDQAGDAKNQVADELLAIKGDFVTNHKVSELLDTIKQKSGGPLAAKLLVRIVLSRGPGQMNKPRTIVVGQVFIEDGKLDPTMVLAQMPILEEGYFAGEIGSLDRPVCFRSHGYEDLDVALKDEEQGIVHVGQITLKPLAKERQASLKGQIALDGASTFDSAEVMLNVSVGPVNTTNGGYSARRHWPAAIKVEISKNGIFEVEGLNPSNYTIFATAKGHLDDFKRVTLTTGQPLEVEPLRLFSSDFSHYIGKPAPTTEALTWEPDFNTALKRAETEKRPMLVMLTATWCGPCKLLEDQTLNDPWIRHFLSPFVMVKAYEDRDVEKRLGAGSGYPTLVFTDSTGKVMHNSIGHMPPHLFVVHYARALKAASLPLPPEIETLIEKKVIKLP